MKDVAFNTPLEMHVGVASHGESDVVGLSILHWRCLIALARRHRGAAEALSILHWRCWSSSTECNSTE